MKHITLSQNFIEKDIDYYMKLIDDSKEVKISFIKVNYITSEYLRWLLNFYRKCYDKKIKLIFINIDDNIKKIFEITNFDKFFNIE